MDITQKYFLLTSLVCERPRAYGISSPQQTTEAQTLEAALRSELSQNVLYNHAFDVLAVRLERIVDAYEKGEIVIGQKIAKLYEIGNDIDRIYLKMEHLGLDVIQFSIFALCTTKGWTQDIIPGASVFFASQIVEYLYDTLPVGWRHSEHFQDFVADTVTYTEYLLDSAYGEKIEIENWFGFVDALQKILLKAGDVDM